MKKFRSFLIFSMVLALLFPLDAAVLAKNSGEDGYPDPDEEVELNEDGVVKGAIINGQDISELTEEELEQFLQENFDPERDDFDYDYEPKGLEGPFQNGYPNVNSYIESMNNDPSMIEYDHYSKFPEQYFRGGYGMMEGVVAHDTGNDTSTIQNEIDYMKRTFNIPPHQAFVQTFVDHNRIVEIHPPNLKAWGAGGKGNERFSHVELVRVHTFNNFARAIDNYAYYIAHTLKQYDLGVTSAEQSGKGSLWSHWAVSKHLKGTKSPDPHQYFERWGYSWAEFTQLVTKKYNEINVVPIYGESRYRTAVRTSQTGWNSANTVVLARGDNYADALAGVPLAAKHNAPLLLTQSNYYTDVTKAEIGRLGAKTVYILGGVDAVSKEVENEIRKQGATVKRIEGDRRTETAVEIAKEIGGNEAMVVDGYNFPDAVSAAAYAAQEDMPILLTLNDQLSNDTKEAIADLNITETIVVGGPVAVSEKVMNQLPSPERIDGTNRYGTSVELAKHFLPNNSEYYVATGQDYPDALTSAVLAAKNNTGVLLVHGGIPFQVRDFLNGSKANSLKVIGGPESVAPHVQRDLGKIIN